MYILDNNIQSLVLLAISAYIVILIYRHVRYKRSTYYRITKKSYRSLDTGDFGEYLIYSNLKKCEKNGGKFLFNLYIPNSNGGTTEIDVLLISHNGVFLFESKNFSGWIFGHQQQKYWTQSLPVGKGYESVKTQFYNPIWQNAGHKANLERIIDTPIYSVVVFSDECTFRNVTITTDDVSVVHYKDLESFVFDSCTHKESDLLTQRDIERIYTQLYPYTQTDLETKERHKK